MKSLAWGVLCMAAFVLAACAFGSYRWGRRTDSLVGRLQATRTPFVQRSVDFADLAALPAPVQRYFRAVLTDGQPFIGTARLQHEGQFNMGETGEQWKPFSSRQWTATHRPGFVWDGSIVLAPGMIVRVHDAYVAGEGTLHAALLGLVTLVDMHGTPDMARGELMRYIAEAPLVPTALLPRQGLEWTAVDDSNADLALNDAALRLTLRFTFGAGGLIDAISAKGRGRTVRGGVVETPWRGRWWAYERRDGMLVPTWGEVAWLLPEGPKPYWRGRLTGIEYDFV
jgi:hypothetical protein